MEALWWWPCFDLTALSLILQQMRVVQCWRGAFGGLRQASVLGLEDQIEGLGDIKDEEGGKEKIGLKKREYCQQFSRLKVIADKCHVTFVWFISA